MLYMLEPLLTNAEQKSAKLVVDFHVIKTCVAFKKIQQSFKQELMPK